MRFVLENFCRKGFVFLSMSLSLVLVSSLAQSQAVDKQHGEVIEKSGVTMAWNQHQRVLQSPVEFWLSHAKFIGSTYWGESTAYPKYDDVKEHDTFLVRVPSGICLMEFFHQRWRRANDVRRWDDKFNNLEGCADVFG